MLPSFQTAMQSTHCLTEDKGKDSPINHRPVTISETRGRLQKTEEMPNPQFHAAVKRITERVIAVRLRKNLEARSRKGNEKPQNPFFSFSCPNPTGGRETTDCRVASRQLGPWNFHFLSAAVHWLVEFLHFLLAQPLPLSNGGSIRFQSTPFPSLLCISRSTSARSNDTLCVRSAPNAFNLLCL